MAFVPCFLPMSAKKLSDFVGGYLAHAEPSLLGFRVKRLAESGTEIPD